jgi:hypothetical protein
MRKRASTLAVGLLLFLPVLLLLLPASPFVQKLPSWDSGVFLYTGWRVTEGALPYRDVWDHKPPLIFLIDALGIWLGGGSRWGVWVLEVVSLTLALALALDLVRRAFGKWSAWYAVIAVLVSAFLTMDGGNYTTEFALPVQFALLWLVGTASQDIFSGRRAFLLGVLSAILFWLKQNDIGIPCAIVIYLGLQTLFGINKRAGFFNVLVLAGGSALVSALVIAPFAFAGALDDFWQAAFAFNFVYIQETWFDRLVVLRYVPIFIPAMGLALFATMGWLVGAFALGAAARTRKNILADWRARLDALREAAETGQAARLTREQMSRLVGVSLLALPIELFGVALSGNPFDHYYLALLPVMAVLAGFWMSCMLGILGRGGLARARGLFVLSLLAVMVLFAAEPVQSIVQRIQARNANALIHFLREQTSADDEIFIWGGEARVLFEAKRRAPSRFVYQAMLVRSRYASVEIVEGFLNELAQRKPRWLINGNGVNPMFVFPVDSEKIRAAVPAILQEYQVWGVVDNWTIYRRREH